MYALFLLYSCFTTALPLSINSLLLCLLLQYSYTCFTSARLLLNIHTYIYIYIYIYALLLLYSCFTAPYIIN